MTEPDPLIGKTVTGRYRVLRALGRGGMGAVYVASQEPLGREVALKVLRPNLADDAVAIERFRNEARLIAALHHPHIVAIHDFDTTPEGVLFIAMELLHGESLAARLRRVGRIAPEPAAVIVRDVARALSAAHRRGVVHRDLKPDNIVLVEADGIGEHAKVLDFGIAKLFTAEGGQQSLTGTGLVPGTPGYISPEQIAGSAHDDPRSDLYALGVTWFEMLTGSRPFRAEHALALFMRQLNEAVPSPSSVAPDAGISPAVDELVLWLTNRDPTARPASADVFLDRLAALVHRGALPAALGAVAAPTPSALPVQTPSPTSVSTIPTADATPAPSAAALTPLTGTTPTMAAAPSADPPTQAATAAPTLTPSPRARWKRAAALALFVVAVVAFGVHRVIGGDAHELLANDLEGEFKLQVHSEEPEVALKMRDAQSSYRRGDLQATRRLADEVLATTDDEPGAYLLKALVALHEEQWFETQRFSAAAKARIGSTMQARYETPAANELIVRMEEASREKSSRGLAAWRTFPGRDELPIGHVAMARAATAHDGRATTEALALIREAKALDPGLVLAYVEEANALLGVGDAAAALHAANQGLEGNPGAPILMLARARALLGLGDIDGAEAQVKKALSMNPGRVGDLLLARIHLLRGSEALRQQLIETQLSSALPDAVAQIAIDHGEALVGAGRVVEALALFERAQRDLLEAGDVELAAYVLLRATRVIGPAVDPTSGTAERLVVLCGELLSTLALPQVPRNVLAAVLSVLETHALAASLGVEAARKNLARLETIDEQFLPAELRAKLLATVNLPLLIAEGKYADALAAADLTDTVCVLHANRALVYVAQSLGTGTHDEQIINDAIAELRWVHDHAPLCTALGAQGVAVLTSLALEVKFHAAHHHPSDAALAAEALRKRFPQAHKDVWGVADALAASPVPKSP